MDDAKRKKELLSDDTRIGPRGMRPIEESGSKRVRRFEPGNLSDDAAGTMRSILRHGSYDYVPRLPRPGGGRWLGEPVRLLKFLRGGVNCWKTSPLSRYYRGLLEQAKGAAPLVLFDLFLLSEPVLKSRLGAAADDSQLRLLEDATVLYSAGEKIGATVRCYPLHGGYFLFDLSRQNDDFVYLGWDSHLMAKIAATFCAQRHFERSLDLCTGSGVQGLSLARQSDETLCADINHRAVAFVEANARLNELRNVSAVHSDLFSAIPGRFDCITANTPYVPEPTGGHLPIRGGDLGIEFTLRLLEEIPDRLTDTGIAIVYTSDPIIRKKRQLMDYVRRVIGHVGMRVIQMPLFRNNYPVTQPMLDHYDRLGLRGYDDCILIIERAKRYETERRHWDWAHYSRTRLETWLDWRRRGPQ